MENYMINKTLQFCIIGYQKAISPMIKPSCRYYPTCSQYTINALREYGTIKGILKAIKRLLTCHPFHSDDTKGAH